MIGYKSADLAAAENMLELHLAKLKKARVAGDYPKACAAIRAISTEAENASRIATSLSLNSHLTRVSNRSTV